MDRSSWFQQKVPAAGAVKKPWLCAIILLGIDVGEVNIFGHFYMGVTVLPLVPHYSSLTRNIALTEG